MNTGQPPDMLAEPLKPPQPHTGPFAILVNKDDASLYAFLAGLKAWDDAPEPLTATDEEEIISMLVRPHQNLLKKPGKVKGPAGALALIQYLVRDNED